MVQTQWPRAIVRTYAFVCAFVEKWARAPAGDDRRRSSGTAFSRRVTGKPGDSPLPSPPPSPPLTPADGGIDAIPACEPISIRGRSFHRHLTHEPNGCNGMAVDTERRDLCPCIRRMNLSPAPSGIHPGDYHSSPNPRAVTRRKNDTPSRVLDPDKTLFLLAATP